MFSEVEVVWSNRTFVFYTVVVFGAYVTMLTGKKYTAIWGNNKRIRANVGFAIAVSILVFVKGFSTTGRDLRAGYYLNFQTATSMNDIYDSSLEIGYRLLNVAIRRLTDQYWIFIFVLALMTIIPVFHFIRKYKKTIDVPAAVLLYTTVYYITGFSALRIYLAASIALFSFDAMIEKRSFHAFGWILVASMFHISMLCLFIPYFFVFIRILKKWMIFASATALFLAIYVLRDSIGTTLLGTERYYIYEVSNAVSLGLEQIVYYAPIFAVIYLGRHRAEKWFSRIGFSYVTTGFCFGMLSYIVPIFGRFYPAFLPIVIIVPYYMKEIKTKYRRLSWLVNVAMVLYCIARYVIYIFQYYILEDLMPYTNIWGLIL